MHGVNRGETSPSVQKGTPEPIIGTARAQLRKAEKLTKVLYFQEYRGAGTRRWRQTAANRRIGPTRECPHALREQFGTDADRSACLACLTGEAQHTSNSR